MHEVISFLKDAVKRGAGAMGVQDCYVSDGSTVRAANDVLHAGIDWPSEATFTVPAEAVDAFLSRAKDIDTIDVNEDNIVLKSGRLRSTIKRRYQEALSLPDMPEDWSPVPDGFIEALKVAQGFTEQTATGARLWQAAVRVWNGRVTACNGRVLIDIDVGDMAMLEPRLLGKPAVDFLIAQGKPDEFGVERSNVFFRWDDGRWVKCQTVNTEFSEKNLVTIFERAGLDTPVNIDDEWRAAFADAAFMTDKQIWLNHVGFLAKKENVDTVVEMSSDLPEDHDSCWGTGDMEAMLSVATAWHPGAYPDPCFFVGDKVRGVIMGVQK